jgi:hypothetical protein
VYFGTSLSDVNETATPCVEDHNTESYPVSVNLGETYYWRIDEVNGLDTWTGKIWQFTTNDGNAFDPYPADEQTAVPLNPTLHWTRGCPAASHDVYFGTNWGEVNNANSTDHPNVDYNNVDVNSYDAYTPEHLTYYYWRIDEVNGPNTWKGSVWRFRSKTAIFDPNLLVWYKFDETEGNPQDSSGRKFHGAGNDFDEDTWDPCDGKFYPGCINMDSDQRIDLPGLVLDLIGTEITISVWWKEAWRIGDDSWFCGFGDDDIHMAVRAPDSLGEGIQWHAGNDTNDILIWQTDPSAWKDDWHHLVFTKNEGEGTMKIYFDASVVASSNDANSGTLAEAVTRAKSGAGIRIGAQWDNNDDFVGKADNFRLYDYELSQAKISELFRGGDVNSAWAPSPYNGELDVPYDVVLKWKPGDYASSHDVYLGTDWDDVSDANSTNHPNVDYNHVDVNNYDPPGLLELSRVYYWRVDEVNDTNNETWKGDIWKFTVGGYIVIDDMEAYTGNWLGEGDYPLDAGWADYYANGTNALITLQTSSPVRGEQSMEYSYDNAYLHALGYCSEIQSLDLNPTDWTISDTNVLTLWFYGDPGNDANDTEQMYVGVEDSVGLYAELRCGDNENEDMNDIKIADWQPWDMPLRYFSDSNFAAVANDVNLADIDTLAIGFGERYGSQAGGSGYVWFDDIRLNPSFCDSGRVPLEGDLDGDCTVDFGDVEIMAEEWLETDVNLGEVKEPCDANLVGWWRLDNGGGDTATDSSGKDHHGTLQVLDVNVSWVSGRDDVNSALEFDGGRVRVSDHQNLRPLYEVSACAWIYYSEGQSSARVVVKGADNKETFGLEVDGDDELVFHVRDGNDYDAGDDSYEKYDVESADDALARDEWIHVAGTYLYKR